MRIWVRWFAVAVVIILAGIQVVRPARTNPVTVPDRALPARMPVSDEAAAVLDRACRDCHSNDTRWPWYSNIAPVSWFVIDHVNHGRSHFNYSDWAKYDQLESRRLLENACAFARKQTMPLNSYLVMHRGARLTDLDVVALCDWTESAVRLQADQR